MKTAVLALVLTVVAPAHVRLGPVAVPVSWLLVTAEVLAAAGSIWLAARALRGFRPPLFVLARSTS